MRGMLIGLVAAIAAATSGIDATASTETVLQSFQGMADGESPTEGLMAGAGGSLYGMTALKGQTGQGNNDPCSDGCGTIFRLTPPSSQKR